jgi:hypothetical protein
MFDKLNASFILHLLSHNRKSFKPPIHPRLGGIRVLSTSISPCLGIQRQASTGTANAYSCTIYLLIFVFVKASGRNIAGEKRVETRENKGASGRREVLTIERELGGAELRGGVHEAWGPLVGRQ